MRVRIAHTRVPGLSLLTPGRGVYRGHFHGSTFPSRARITKNQGKIQVFCKTSGG